MKEIHWKKWIGLLYTAFILILIPNINESVTGDFFSTGEDIISIKSIVHDNLLMAEYECKDEDGDEQCDEDPTD